MRIRLAIPDRYIDPDVLEAALEASTRAATRQIRAGEAPDVRDLIESNKVRWQAEPWAEEHFDLPSTLAVRGWGDCDDLAPALAASLRASGEDPGARAVVYKSAPHRYHVVTELSDGTRVDPSIWAGMKRHAGIRGAVIRPMAAVGEGALAAMHDGSRWLARCDVPWPDAPAHVSSLARARTLPEALGRAAVGACELGRACSSSRADAAEEVADELLEVGFGFGDIWEAAKTVVPGAGLAEEAVDVATKVARGEAPSLEDLRDLGVEAAATFVPGAAEARAAYDAARDVYAAARGAAAPGAARGAAVPAAARAPSAPMFGPGSLVALPGGATVAVGKDGRTLLVRF